MLEASFDEPAQAPPRTPDEASWFWTLYTWFHVLGWLIVCSGPCIVLGALAILFGDKQRRVASGILAFAYRAIVRTHPKYVVSHSGLHNLGGGPYILCPNHQSLSDVVYLFSLPGHYKWVVKRELFWVPMFGICMRLAGYPAIHRGNIDSANKVMAQVKAYLEAGIPVLNFPEGKRQLSGELGKFQTGAARMAIVNQVPLVPVGVVGTARLMPRGSGMYARDAHISIDVGEPIPTVGLTLKDLRTTTNRLHEAVAASKAVAQARVDAARLAEGEKR
jgi:1-acyl-sn-glycerol-3-phosphate acyltransferase